MRNSIFAYEIAGRLRNQLQTRCIHTEAPNILANISRCVRMLPLLWWRYIHKQNYNDEYIQDVTTIIVNADVCVDILL